MAVAAPDLSPLELSKSARSDHLELARGVLDVVEIRHQLIVGQRCVINDQQAVNGGPHFAHVEF
jgi:hypothetical protein